MLHFDLANPEIRERVAREGIPLWRVAQALGVCEMTLQRWLRVPLSEEKETAINRAIDTIIARRTEK